MYLSVTLFHESEMQLVSGEEMLVMEKESA